jgi:hypothetical protein
MRCAGGPTIEQQEFGGEINLQNWGDWTLSLAEENRSNGITNISNSGNYGLYADAQLRLIPGLTNTSPVFTSTLLPYICGNQFHRFSFAAFDADGDSLVYRVISPQAATSFDPCPSPMQLVLAPHFTIGAATGELATVPFTLNVGNYVMAVRVEEYRRISNQWAQIGSVMRDIMYPVSAGTGNRNPTFTDAAGVGLPATTQVIRVNPGRAVSLTLTAADPDAGQALRFSSEGLAAIPGASFQSISATQARLTWQVPTTMPAGRYTVPVAVTDNACPVNGTTIQTVTFQVTNEVLATDNPRPLVLSAYPMPFQHQVRFQLPTPSVQPVVITDGLGRVVATLQSRPDGTVEWQPTAEVAAGIYFARPINGAYTFRLLRQ